MGVEEIASLSLQFLLPLFAVAISEGIIFYYVLWRPKYQSPGTRKVQSARSLFTSCLKATFLSRTSLVAQAYRLFFGRCGTPSVIHAMRV